MTHLPELNWQQLRGKAPSGSRQDGFEELANQLMIYGGLVEWPPGTRFSTFGNPDGGREGRAELPDGGGVWAWQAKYLFGLDTAEITQITKSVKRALSTEPDLRRYYVLLPYNRPAGDTTTAKGTKTSAWTKWNNAVTEWETEAQAKGLTVTFEYVGETQLNNCLLQQSQVGRLRYWFDREAFTSERFQQIAAQAAADADGRYDPRLTVEVPAAAAFTGLARTPTFEQNVRTTLAAFRKVSHLTAPEDHRSVFAPALTELRTRLTSLEMVLADAVVQARQIDGHLPDPGSAAEAAAAALDHVTSLLYEHGRHQDRYFIGAASSLYVQTTALQAALSAVFALRAGQTWQAFGRNAVLLHGTGGAGKTHLLCDLANSRAAQHLPTIIVLAEQFEHGPIETDIGRIIGFTSPAGQLLATFDAACQDAGEIGLLVIDGLNETTDRQLWNRYLNSFLNEIATYRHIRLVLSCRSEFLDDTLSPALLTRLHQVRHAGFAGVERDAIKAFLDFYGIERPSFPLLDPEFTNPLFLKLLCRTLQARHEHQFPRTGIGTSWIYSNFLDAVNERLANPQRCDYSDRKPLVRTAVEHIAALMHAHGRRLPFDDVEQVTTSLLDGRGFSNGLLNGLLKEAILSDLLVDGATYIRFGYERLGDIALARLVSAAGRPELDDQVTALAESWYRNAGVLQALASVLPETHGVELLDVLSITTDTYHGDAYRDFLLSLSWRRPEAVTDRTVEILIALHANPDVTDDATNALLQVATVAGHRLNADWLHQRLAAMTMPERDRTWSHLCDWQDDTGGHLPNLISWAWSPASSTATDETRRLTGLTLTWALAASDRPTRDNATKAIIAVLEPAPNLYPPLLHRFAGCGDDAIEERLLAVGCGLAQRTRDSEAAIAVARAIWDHTIGRGVWPQNYLSRDYARRAIEAGVNHGWLPAGDDPAARIRPPYTTAWIEPGRTAHQIEELSGAPDYTYSAIRHPVLSEFDDFYRYVVEPLTDTFDLGGAGDAEYLGRILFDQVLLMGWTPEQFRNIDRNLRHGRSGEGRQHEGYAQKYAWTAVKQLIGRMTDRFPLRPEHRDHGRVDYQTPLDVHGHDIDPTTLLRRTENRVYADTPAAWFAPATMTFPDGLDEGWATHDQDSPPADSLIVCADDTGRRWLTLEGHYRWSQPKHPDEVAAETPHHAGWMQIRSYLIDAAFIEDWRTWAERQDWHGRWMPESGSPTGLLLADHPYQWGWPGLTPDDRTGSRKDPPPAKPIVTTTRYGGVSNSWDQSDSKHLYTYLPSSALCDMLGLQRLDDVQWGRDGQLQAEGFAARTIGPESAHVCLHALRDGLTANNKAMLWTVTAVKETIRSEYHDIRAGDPLERRYWASYLFDGAHVSLIAASARTLFKGGRMSDPAKWNIAPELPI